MDGFVTAVSTKTGRKRRVPAEWLEPGHVFANDWKLPPSAATEEPPAKRGTAQHSDDTTAVAAASTTTDATPGDPNTPAAGGEQEY